MYVGKITLKDVGVKGLRSRLAVQSVGVRTPPCE